MKQLGFVLVVLAGLMGLTTQAAELIKEESVILEEVIVFNTCSQVLNITITTTDEDGVIERHYQRQQTEIPPSEWKCEDRGNKAT